MLAFMVLWASVAIAADVFAWLNGAFASESQVWLAVDRRIWGATYVLAFLSGVLIRHVSVAGAPSGPFPPGEFYVNGLVWSAFMWCGMWATYMWLWQLPAID